MQYEIDHLEVLNIQEDERQRIATELHDSSVQNLTHLVHMIELGSMCIDQDPIRAKLELENCIKILKSTIDEIRETIFNLRPMAIDDLGFRQCIENFITDAQVKFKNSRIAYDVCELPDSNLKNNQIFLITLYRIIQEAMSNALKHSEAENIILNVSEANRRCYITIEDDGKGFSLEEAVKYRNKHFGLLIMKERVGLLHGSIVFNSEIGTGTKVEIEIPLD